MWGGTLQMGIFKWIDSAHPAAKSKMATFKNCLNDIKLS
jgi:hypothetical protein